MPADQTKANQIAFKGKEKSVEDIEITANLIEIFLKKPFLAVSKLLKLDYLLNLIYRMAITRFRCSIVSTL